MPSPYVDYKHGREDAEKGHKPKHCEDKDYMMGYEHGIQEKLNNDTANPYNDFITGMDEVSHVR